MVATIPRTVSLRGSLELRGDKSISHRMVLMSLLSRGDGLVHNLSECGDLRTSIEAARSLGSGIRRVSTDSWSIHGTEGRARPTRSVTRCDNSGTTMRLLMGILAGMEGSFRLDGDASLRRRPMERVAEPLRLMGADARCTDGRCPVDIEGGELRSLGVYRTVVPSAQLKSAVLLAASQVADGGTTTVVERYGSRDHTERLLEIFGASVARNGNGCRIGGSRLRMPASLRVPGDPSSAAFPLTAAALLPGSDVVAEGMLLSSGRTGFIRVLRRMGAHVTTRVSGYYPEPHGRARCRYGSPGLTGCRVRASEVPSMIDEIPVLALAATQAAGRSIFEGVGELRVKESDRLSTLAGQLSLMGASMVVDGDRLVVDGPTPLRDPGTLRSGGDHRIAMTLSLACMIAGSGHSHLSGEPCVSVSWPGFAGALERLARG